ncbi:MAG: cytochrome c3 family protein [Longimicrobiales bacterium]|nr:cytochrome c3 family protein [Longimicrobiales bacterium]
MRRSAHSRRAPGLLLLAFLAAHSGAAAQAPRPSCESCHGELEFLRQHVSTLDEARALLAPVGVLTASAHGEMTCTDCHDGFRRFPHPDASTTTPCASCHEVMAAKWREGMHALDDAAECTDCHGIHDVRSREALSEPEGIRAMRSACASCHYEPRTPAWDPHADSVSCASCHEPHATLPSEEEGATTHVLNQATTCGACHEEQAASWRDDVHGHAAPEVAMPGGQVPEGASRAEPPACTGCHGAHGIIPPDDAGFRTEMVARCSHCHERFRESFADSYHGQAANLGSDAVATCHDCHGSHGVYPPSDSRSSVSEANLLATCQTCHETATAGFAKFQPHADHNDRERYPYVYWSYHLMTALLLGVFLVFGAHTALWLARLGVDALRGGPTSHHDPRG